MNVIFCDEDCTCDHMSYMHDDGFGCTEQGCPCLAGWRVEQ